MRRSAKSFISLGAALAGLLLVLVYPPVAVAVTFIAAFMAWPMDYNVPAGRAAYYGAILCNAAAIYHGSGSLLLAAVPVPIGLALVPSEVLLRRGPAVVLFAPMVALAVSLALLAAAWPTGVWGFAVAPWALSVVAMFKMLSIRRSYDVYAARPKRLKVGQPMPALRLPRRDDAGEFDLAEQKGRFTLVCFLRGDWCPMCHVMMRLFRKEAPRLAQYNVQLISVSPDCGPAAQEFARDLGLDYTMLVDEHARLAAEWGVLEEFKHDGDPVPMPVCMLVDPDGILRFMSRPDDFSTFVDETKVLALVEVHASKAA
jgi:peroxiredoxin